MKYFAGYTFCWPRCCGDIWPWVRGVVVTPRYAKRLARERRKAEDTSLIMLDNGAWPAFKKGEILAPEEQVAQMLEADELLGGVDYVVVPDVVGDPLASSEAARIAEPLMGRWAPSQRFLVVQDGADLDAMVARAWRREIGGLFIGGKDKTWKLETAARAADAGVYVHVGRVASEKELDFCAGVGVSSIDNTTFMRNYGTNATTDYTVRLRKTCEEKEK